MNGPAWHLVLAAADGALLQTLADHFRPILAQAPNAPELLAVQHPEQLPPDMGPTSVVLLAAGPPLARLAAAAPMALPSGVQHRHRGQGTTGPRLGH